MLNAVDTWLNTNPDFAADPLRGMARAGLLAPAPDYATIARVKARLVEHTGLLGIASVWGGGQQVYRHFLSFGSNAQRAAWAGKSLAVGISEPNVGAHPKLLMTRAERDGEGYRLNGTKAWVTNGPDADAVIVFAVTSEEAGRKRYSAFIVPRAADGVATEPMPGFHALRPSRHCLLTLRDVHVPASAMLSDPDVAYDRMALPFRDIEDAIGTFAILGALRYAIRVCGSEDAEALGAIVALTAVFAAGAESIVAALDAARFRTGNATLVGLRVLALDILARLRALAAGDSEILSDLEAVLGIARGPRLARQVQLGQAAIRGRQ